jgi:hypothetical protein
LQNEFDHLECASTKVFCGFVDVAHNLIPLTMCS